jgi:DNA-binding transcriptional LysR family regulator
MGQPNLSRAIKELEESLGITIFERTTKGIRVTPDGEEFLQYAKSIISQVEDVEAMYRNGHVKKQKFSACVPRASYISYAMAEFAKHIDTQTPADIFYKETNSMRTINNILNDTFNLGIVRYQTAFEKYYKSLFSAKKLVTETITEFNYCLLMSREHPLAADNGRKVRIKDLVGENLIVPSRKALIDTIYKWFRTVGEEPKIVCEMDSYLDAAALAGRKVGLSIYPRTAYIPNDSLISKEIAGNKKMEYLFVWRKGHPLPVIEEKFIDFVKDKVMDGTQQQ